MQAWGPAPMMEFEVLVGRAARTGRVRLSELYDVYALAAQAALPGLLDVQRLDIDAVAQAIKELPSELHGTGILRLVPDLSAFTHTALATGLGRAGRQTDGAIAWEVRDGPAGVLTRVALLALVGHEARKAQRLRAAFGEAPLDPATWAIAMGQDEAALTKALAQTQGELLPWLARERAPEVRIHPALSPQRWAERGTRSAEMLILHMAEAGLIGRPLHVWIAPAIVTACVSPYTRELRPALMRWAQAQQAQQKPADWQPLGEAPNDDALYAIARDFLRQDPRLLPEKRLAERTVGIVHHPLDGMEVDIIDCARLDMTLCDARLAPPAKANFGAVPPVIVRIDSAGKALEAPCLARLFTDLGTTIQSITIITEGALDPGALEHVQAINAVWPWGASVPINLPNAPHKTHARSTLLSAPISPAVSAWGNAQSWPRKTGHPSTGASVTTAMLASVLWQSAATGTAIGANTAGTANAAGAANTAGGAGAARSVNVMGAAEESSTAHAAKPPWDAAWWHVRGDMDASAPASCAAITSHANLATARLRQLWWPPRPSTKAPAPNQPTEPEKKRGESSPWAMRIKA